ncbi:MAG: electron transport complex subunit RsxC [bacterium]
MKRLFSFKGGVHPPYFKEVTSGQPLRRVSLPKKVVIPLSQHTGKPARPVVKVGDEVKTGQLIGESDGFISLPVHCSLSGKVLDIRPWPHPLGHTELSVIVESDGRDEWISDSTGHEDYFRFSPEELREVIKRAGIAGLGGAAFPTHVKLTPPENCEIDTVILNGCECEPYLTCDHRLMLEYPPEILEGLKIIMQTVDAHRGIVGVEANKTDAISLLEKEIRREPAIDLAVLKVKYPQGAEKHLIDAILKRRVPPGKLPLDVGVVVDNVGTAFAVRQAVKRGIPLIERAITVTGSGIKQPQNLWVRLGTLFADVVSQCGGLEGNPEKIIAGGPMMGIAQYTLDVPSIKSTSGILILSEAETFPEGDCIRCGKCIDACPVNLMPTVIAQHVKHKDWASVRKYNPFDCTECGSCAYVCPGKIPLVQYIKWGKEEVRD